jgi:ACS family hexuronate transporter-like MFS transporter
MTPSPFRKSAGESPGIVTSGFVHRSRFRWIAIGFVFLATTVNYLDRQTLSILAPALLDQFRMTNAEYGEVVAAFMLAYTVMNGVSGRIIDRLGAKLGYVLTILVWSTAEILHVFARGAMGLGLCRLLLGAGEAGNWPAGIKVVAEWFPPKERALASGIFNSGSALGALLAPPAVAFLAIHYGWRSAFGLMGCLGFLWAAAWMIFYKRPTSTTRETISEERPFPFRVLLRSRFLWQFTAAKIFIDPVWYFYTFWFPQYLKMAGGFTLKTIGETAWIPFAAAGIGNLAGGYLGGKILSRSRSSSSGRKLSIVLFLLPMALGTFIIPAGSAVDSLALASLATFGYTAALANMLALPADQFPNHTVASVWGFASMGSGFGGMLFSAITGILVDRFSFTPVFLLFGAVSVLAMALIWKLPE